MALLINDKFAPRANPGDTNYPDGSIKNESVPGAKDGTPLDADWGNDYAGGDAALFAEVGITPDGNPDTALNSQRLDALKLLDIKDLSQAYEFANVADALEFSNLVNGKVLSIAGAVSKNDGFGATWDTYPSGTFSLSDTVKAHNTLPLQIVQRDKTQLQTNIDAVSAVSLSKNRLLSRFENQGFRDADGSQLYIVGDSITEGSNTLDFANDPYAALVRNAINQKNNNNNHGFVNIRTVTAGATNFHTITKSGFGADLFNAAFYGGAFISSTTIGDFVEIAYVGRTFQIVYDQLLGNGTFEIRIDGVLVETVDSNGTENRGVIGTQHNTANFDKRLHVIRITNITNSPVNILGVVYSDGYNTINPVVQNVGRSSITGAEITDNTIDKYSTFGAQIIALGVNDSLLSTDVAVFKAKLQRFCQNNLDVNGETLLLDFIFNESRATNVYKQAIYEVSQEFADNVSYVDFAELWFADLTLNQKFGLVDVDNVHPTPRGHRRIADVVLSWLGYSSLDAKQFVTKSVIYNVKSGATVGGNERIQLSLASVVGGSTMNQAAWINSLSVQVKAEVLYNGFWHSSGWYTNASEGWGVAAFLFGQLTNAVNSAKDSIIIQSGNDGCLFLEGKFSGGTQGAIGGNQINLPVRLVLSRS